MELFTLSGITALLQVIAIDLVLAGDNAVVIGLAAAGLAADIRRRAILIGIIAATVLRIGFALVTTQLLALGGGLLVAGGLLLLWVCWKMYRELATPHQAEHEAVEALANADINADGTVAGKAPRKTLRQAVIQIIIADVSMSLDNVLAVAGAAQHHFEALIFGLALSVVMMGVAASFIAGLLNRFRWIAWVGLVIILYVAIRMFYEGVDQLVGHTLPAIPLLKSGSWRRIEIFCPRSRNGWGNFRQPLSRQTPGIGTLRLGGYALLRPTALEDWIPGLRRDDGGRVGKVCNRAQFPETPTSPSTSR